MPNSSCYLRLLLLSIGYPFIISYTSSNGLFRIIPFGANTIKYVTRSTPYNNNIQIERDSIRIYLTEEGNDDNNIVHNIEIESSNDDNDNDTTSTTTISEKRIEKTWRYVKKPLLSIGSKGITASHGNSLRELLLAHQVVKVKINISNFKSSSTSSFEQLKNYAIISGAPEGIELIQTRDIDRIILVGLPGILQEIQNGTFPPPPPPKWEGRKRDENNEE